MWKLFNKGKETPTDKESVLIYSDKNKAYTLDWPYEEKAVFIGDHEDYCNCLMKNFKPINKKYNLNYDFYALKLNYELQVTGQPIIAYSRMEEEKNLMPFGIYSLVQIDFSETGFRPLTINTDDFVDFHNEELNLFQKKLKTFFKNRKKYEKLKIRHKGATLLYGPPGNGKTQNLINITKKLEKSTYCIFVNKGMSLSALNEYKSVFKGHDVIIILEEITERLGHGTEDLLNFLDGYASWDNCYVIATTNHPEFLPSNLANRPGRFNNLLEIKLPTDEQKTIFLTQKGFSPEEIKAVLPKTKDFSIDEISQLAIHSKLEELPLDVYLKVLDENKKKAKNAFKGKSSMGIS